jgi:hypothetical protein
MAIHYFHCTNGLDLVIDQNGHETRNSDENTWRAQAVAARLMRELPDYAEWSNWAVHVYDEFGLLNIVDFPVERRRAA